MAIVIRMEDIMIVMHIQSSILSACFEMENVITVLPESVTKTC